MKIEVKAKLILTIPELGREIGADEIILAAEQYINQFGYFTIPTSDVEIRLKTGLREAVNKCRKEIEVAYPQARRCTQVGIRIHTQEMIKVIE